MNCRLLLAAVVLTGLTAGCAQSDPGITTAITTKLAADDLVKARRIDVDTRDRVVTLTGEVSSSGERDRAVQIARDTNGVRSVVDQLNIVPETAATSGAAPSVAGPTDAGITTAVKSKLLASTDVSGLQINVDTNNSVVTLTGTVPSQAEKAAALRLARETDGVTSVTDHLIVEPRR